MFPTSSVKAQNVGEHVANSPILTSFASAPATHRQLVLRAIPCRLDRGPTLGADEEANGDLSPAKEEAGDNRGDAIIYDAHLSPMPMPRHGQVRAIVSASELGRTDWADRSAFTVTSL